MLDATDTTVMDQLRLANRDLAVTPFYIGTTRRRIAGLGLAVQFNREQGGVAGSIVADLLDRPHQPGQPHPLAATAVTICGGDHRRVVGAGSLDAAGQYARGELSIELCYYLHFGEE
jgi:hypothetical protein